MRLSVHIIEQLPNTNHHRGLVCICEAVDLSTRTGAGVMASGALVW